LEFIIKYLLILILISGSLVTKAENLSNLATQKSVSLAVLIDDMGQSLRLNQAALALPGAVSFAFLPFSPYSKKLANKARQLNREVMLHVPMENVHNYPLGPGAMTAQMSEIEFKTTLLKSIRAIPHLTGMNNHMGSKLTTLNPQMRWTMEVAKAQRLFFLDSKTTSASVALQQAREVGVTSIARDIFLDHELSLEAINTQFERSIAIAKKRGYAVVIGHPHALTVKFLQHKLGTLAARGVNLVSVSSLISQLSKTYSHALALHETNTEKP
jgi:polysaccharide deacetylase 2 family uncharacterized protein YibQ